MDHQHQLHRLILHRAIRLDLARVPAGTPRMYSHGAFSDQSLLRATLIRHGNKRCRWSMIRACQRTSWLMKERRALVSDGVSTAEPGCSVKHHVKTRSSALTLIPSLPLRYNSVSVPYTIVCSRFPSNNHWHILRAHIPVPVAGTVCILHLVLATSLLCSVWQYQNRIRPIICESCCPSPCYYRVAIAQAAMLLHLQLVGRSWLLCP